MGDERVKFEGIPVMLGGRSYIVPPLSTGQMRKYETDIEALGQSSSVVKEQLLATKLAHAALTRNYPDLTIDELEEWVDARNVKDLIGAIFGQSAVSPVGELKAPQSSAGESTGTASTPN